MLSERGSCCSTDAEVRAQGRVQAGNTRLSLPLAQLMLLQWKKYKMVLFENVGALAEAVKKLPKAGQSSLDC